MNSPAMLNRVLDQSPCPDLEHYLERGGGRALESARKIEPEVIVDLITESGLVDLLAVTLIPTKRVSMGHLS